MATQIIPSVTTILVSQISSRVSLSAPFIPPADAVRDVDAAIRNDFQSWRDLYFFWLMVSTALVAIGVVLEEVEELKMFKRHFGVKIAKKVAKFGWSIILVGVIGEGIFEGYMTKADSWLQTLNTSLLTGSQRDADANELAAADANERAGNLEIDAEELQKENINAQARLGLEKKHLLLLEQQVGWRHINARDVARRVKKYPRTQFEIRWLNNPECDQLATLISGALQAGSWRMTFFQIIPLDILGPPEGVVISAEAEPRLPPADPSTVVDAANSLFDALSTKESRDVSPSITGYALKKGPSKPSALPAGLNVVVVTVGYPRVFFTTRPSELR